MIKGNAGMRDDGPSCLATVGISSSPFGNSVCCNLQVVYYYAAHPHDHDTTDGGSSSAAAARMIMRPSWPSLNRRGRLLGSLGRVADGNRRNYKYD